MRGQSGTRTMYEVIGVSETATRDEIHVAWRTRVRGIHPDLAKGARDAAARTRATSELNAAWNVLRDVDSRREYDLDLADERMASAAPGPAPQRPDPARGPERRPGAPRPSVLLRVRDWSIVVTVGAAAYLVAGFAGWTRFDTVFLLTMIALVVGPVLSRRWASSPLADIARATVRVLSFSIRLATGPSL